MAHGWVVLWVESRDALSVVGWVDPMARKRVDQKVCGRPRWAYEMAPG